MRELWKSTPDHVINWQIKNTIEQISRRLQSPFMSTIPTCHVIHSFDPATFDKFVVQLSRELQTLNLVGIHSRMRGYYSFISRDLIVLKQIKAIIPRLVLAKGTHPYRPCNLWLSNIPITEECHITTFAKVFLEIKFERHKNKCNKMNLFVRFKGQLIHVIS